MTEPKRCRIDGCTKPPRGSICTMHEARIRRTGSAEPGRFAHGTVAERYWRHVVRGEGCWGWAATTNNHGYGMLGRLYAHRVSWEIHRGEIPSGTVVMHKCDNPPCSNPDHLSLGTQKDNMADASSKGRLADRPARYGAANPFSKLTSEQVVEIRALRADGLTCREVARRFSVSPTTVGQISRGETRVHG